MRGYNYCNRQAGRVRRARRGSCIYLVVCFPRTRTHAHDASPNLQPRKRLTPFLPWRWGASFGPDFARGASGKRPLCNLISLPSQHFTPIDTDSAALSLVTAFQARHSPSPHRLSKGAFLPRISSTV